MTNLHAFLLRLDGDFTRQKKFKEDREAYRKALEKARLHPAAKTALLEGDERKIRRLIGKKGREMGIKPILP
jgi:hypothetical protein